MRSGQPRFIVIFKYIFFVKIWISSESRKTRRPAAWGIKGLSRQVVALSSGPPSLRHLRSTVVCHLKVCALFPTDAAEEAGDSLVVV